MLRSFTIISFVLFFTINALGAGNFYPGYIIKVNGDSLSGLISSSDWDQNPSEIIFKETESSASELFAPGSLRKFIVRDETYVSAHIKTNIHYNPYKLDVQNAAEYKISSFFFWH